MSALPLPVPLDNQHQEESQGEEGGMEMTKKPKYIRRPVRQRKRESIYEINIVVQPPATARSGAKLYPPITALLQIRDSYSNEEIPSNGQLTSIWAIVSAVDKDNQHRPVLMGTLLDSAHPFYDDSDGAKAEEGASALPSKYTLGSYLTFPDIFFTETGDFKIRIMLMKIGSDTTLEGASMLKDVFSHTVHIGDGAHSNEISDEEKSVLQFLQGRGIPAETQDIKADACVPDLKGSLL
ncbi:MAG: hypothetical protein M1840_000617 [Geoglossum simile]|nr:MAG: hypothetical protein M1840_000617 [Geoglossum simile]